MTTAIEWELCKRFHRCQSQFVTQLTKRTGFRSAGLLGLIFVGIMVVGLACQVPVFRFALERWEADSYTIVIVPGSQGKLSAAEEKISAFLQSKGSADAVTANLKVRIDPENVGELVYLLGKKKHDRMVPFRIPLF